jgi:hypothetical protein
MTVLENVIVACRSPRAREAHDKESRALQLLGQVARRCWFGDAGPLRRSPLARVYIDRDQKFALQEM